MTSIISVHQYYQTLIPAGILIGIAFPSLKLLYMMEEELGIDVTVKAVGHQ